MISLVADLFIVSQEVVTIVLVFHLFHDFMITPVRLYNALCFTLRGDWERIGSRALEGQILHWRCMSTEGRADELIDSLTSAGSREGFLAVGTARRWLGVLWEGGDLGELDDFMLNAELID